MHLHCLCCLSVLYPIGAAVESNQKPFVNVVYIYIHNTNIYTQHKYKYIYKIDNWLRLSIILRPELEPLPQQNHVALWNWCRQLSSQLFRQVPRHYSMYISWCELLHIYIYINIYLAHMGTTLSLESCLTWHLHVYRLALPGVFGHLLCYQQTVRLTINLGSPWLVEKKTTTYHLPFEYFLYIYIVTE